MDLKKAIGFGAAIWILMFVIVSIFVAFDLNRFALIQVLTAVISGTIAFILAGVVKPKSVQLALGYGATWVIVGLVLDALITTRFNADIFSSWSLWFGYALVLVAPIFGVNKSLSQVNRPPSPPTGSQPQ